MKYIAALFTRNKYRGDMSEHRRYTTHYEDLCQ